MRHCGRLLLLDDIRDRLRPTGESFVGLREIEVERIVGTVDRCCDFDRCFHPTRADLAARVGVVARAFADGAIPPIDVVQVDRAYFVVDGHKRVAAARRSGVAMIDASVTRLAVRYPIDARTEDGEIALLGAEDRFLRESCLERAQPGARVPCLSERSYVELLQVVKAHGYDLVRAEEGLLPAEEVAAHWYDCDYRATIRVAREAGVADLLACCPDGELYLALHRLAWAAPGTDCEALQTAAREATAGVQPPRRRRRPWRRSERPAG
jgi:hypothetical protein